jgi:hypothetical protein
MLSAKYKFRPSSPAPVQRPPSRCASPGADKGEQASPPPLMRRLP